MEEHNYRVIIEPFDDETKEKHLVNDYETKKKDLTDIVTKYCRGCGLFPLLNGTYCLQTSYPIPQECRDSILKLGITLKDFVKGSHDKPTTPSRKVVEASKRVLVSK
jgi:hypothetical protein